MLDKFNCASCHQVQPGTYRFPMTAGIQAILEKKHSDFARSLKSKTDIVFAAHSAWFSPHSAVDAPTAYGILDTKKAAAPGATTGEIMLTEALKFTGRDRQVRQIRAGEIVALPLASLSSSPALGGTFTDLMASYLKRKGEQDYNDNDKARSALPPPLLREGERVQPDWLYRFLLDPGPIRPESYMKLRMPKVQHEPRRIAGAGGLLHGLGAAGQPGGGDHRAVRGHAAAGRGRTGRRLRRSSGTGSRGRPRGRPRRSPRSSLEVPKSAKGAKADPYTRAGFALLMSKDVSCVTCHRIGTKAGPEKPKGPNLVLAADRLRPEWTEEWIANPARMFSYTPVMPQNFANSPDPKEWKHQQLFEGTPLQQTRAVRDLLMDKARLAALLEGYTPPAEPKPKEEKKAGAKEGKKK